MLKNKWVKRALMGIGVLFGLFVLAALLVPMFVNVDSYRPQIVQTANEKLNGKLEMGKLSLSMWGTIKVGVDGFNLTDANGVSVVSAKDVYFKIPWLSILTLSPAVNFTMNKPEVHVVKSAKGKLNVLGLMKKDAGAAATPTTPAPGAPGGAGKPSIPGIAQRARLGIEMNHANLTYDDKKTNLSSKVQDLNVLVKDASLSHTTTVEVSANLDTTMGKSMKLKGPAKMVGKGEPKFEGGQYKESKLTFTAGLDDVEIVMPDLFEKKKGVAANAEGTLRAGLEEAFIDSLVLRFFNAEIKVTGGATGLQSEEGPKFDVKFASNEVNLKAWSDLVPMLKTYELGGTAHMEGQAAGQGDKLTYSAFAEVKKLTAKAPNLKAQPSFDASIKVITDQVESMKMTMTAPGTSLLVTGKVVSFTKPKVTIDVTSPGMDLDQLVEWPKSTTKSGDAPAAAAPPGGGAPSAGSTPASDFDKMLDPLRSNEISRDMTAVMKMKIDSLKAYNAKMVNMVGLATFKGLAANVEKFSMGLWSGSVTGTMSAQLAPKTPTYNLTANATKVDLKQAMTSQMDLFKNTVQGIANFNMTGAGASFNPEPAKKNLNVKGSMRIEQAQFNTIDVGKVAAEAINKSMGQVIAKVPGMNGKTLQAPSNIDSKYEFVTSNFTIAGGVFTSPDFFAKAVPNKGLDIRGATTLNIVDYGVKADWEVLDTYNLLQARNLNVNIAGTDVPHILAEGNDPVRFPIKVEGNAFSPKINYTSVPEALAKVALNNITKAGEARLKAEVQKKAEEAAKGALQDLGKKLFGN